ncbi:hypothetical protein JCM2811A_00400 [Methylorubrum rhodinum]
MVVGCHNLLGRAYVGPSRPDTCSSSGPPWQKSGSIGWYALLMQATAVWPTAVSCSIQAHAEGDGMTDLAQN